MTTDAENFLIAERGKHTFVFAWNDQYAAEVLATAARWRDDDSLPFDDESYVQVREGVIRLLNAGHAQRRRSRPAE